MKKHVNASQLDARFVLRVIEGLPASDGAGVELTRLIGQPALPMLDPFLLLDAFGSDQPQDYMAGFPPHPHRGFETVTYLLAGRMRHKDSAGHEGVIEPGGVQWMTAGRGIVHSEMPEQENGLLAGFQLWINLPAEYKMMQPSYQEFPANMIPLEERPTGVEVRVLAGTTCQGAQGPVRQPLTDPLYLDVTMQSGAQFKEILPASYNAFLYLIQGDVNLEDAQGNAVSVRQPQLAVLSLGGLLALNAGQSGARFLLVSGKPINEPVARGGPFVMNSQAEIRQAFADYQQGKLR